MKLILIFLTSLSLSACMLSPTPRKNSRKVHPALSDLDNLEMLLLNDQQPLVTQKRKPATTDYLHLGMGKNNVQRSLGIPTQVEVAGNPKYENERWIYETQVPTMDGFYSERRVIYFENGTVVGWESE